MGYNLPTHNPLYRERLGGFHFLPRRVEKSKHCHVGFTLVSRELPIYVRSSLSPRGLHPDPD